MGVEARELTAANCGRELQPTASDVSVTVVLVPGGGAAPQLLTTVLGWQQAQLCLWIVCSLCCSLVTRRWSCCFVCERVWARCARVLCGCGVCGAPVENVRACALWRAAFDFRKCD
eukprot:3758630-Prymnesium_polylepis.1